MWTPYFAQRVPTRRRDSFFYLFGENVIFRKDLESPLIFVLFLRENKIRKKTLSVTTYLEKMVCEKTKVGSGGQVTYWEGTIKRL